MLALAAGCIGAPPASVPVTPNDDSGVPTDGARPEMGPSDMRTPRDMGAPDGSTSDVATDAAPDDGPDLAPEVIVQELEPNDTVATATPFALGQRIAGTTDDATDDFFVVTLDGPSLVEIELTSDLSAGTTAVLAMQRVDNAISHRAIPAHTVRKRRFFVPEPAEYKLWFWNADPMVEYEFAVREAVSKDKIEGRVLDGKIPGPLLTGAMDDFTPDIYSLTLATSSEVLARLGRYANDSRFDPFLIVYQPGVGIVDSNDDLGAGEQDSSVLFDVQANEEYWVVATSWNMEQPSDYGLVVTVAP